MYSTSEVLDFGVDRFLFPFLPFPILFFKVFSLYIEVFVEIGLPRKTAGHQDSSSVLYICKIKFQFFNTLKNVILCICREENKNHTKGHLYKSCIYQYYFLLHQVCIVLTPNSIGGLKTQWLYCQHPYVVGSIFSAHPEV